ncbi:hypothetical protein ACT3CD_15360 [Geofilum sp. OHC36d9]|uniref:hypothetical protein n=1 Tax=Geofilum sp. OHC36d9 TaxID=3458413 RepID=UPI0040333248
MTAKKYLLLLLVLFLFTLGACRSTSRAPKPCNCSNLWYSAHSVPADDLASIQNVEE